MSEIKLEIDLYKSLEIATFCTVLGASGAVLGLSKLQNTPKTEAVFREIMKHPKITAGAALAIPALPYTAKAIKGIASKTIDLSKKVYETVKKHPRKAAALGTIGALAICYYRAGAETKELIQKHFETAISYPQGAMERSKNFFTNAQKVVSEIKSDVRPHIESGMKALSDLGNGMVDAFKRG